MVWGRWRIIEYPPLPWLSRSWIYSVSTMWNYYQFLLHAMCWKGRRLFMILIMFLLFRKRFPFGRVKRSHFFKILMNQGLKMCLRCMGNRAAPAQPMYDTLWEEKKTWYLIVVCFCCLLFMNKIAVINFGIFFCLHWI